MGYQCAFCGKEFDEIPMCFGSEAPWYLMVDEPDFEKRVELTKDQCVVDEKHFFIRGHIEIPVVGLSEAFVYSVWCSLSENSFRHMTSRWHDPDRTKDPPYFGWLMTPIPIYPKTIYLKTSVQSRGVGVVPSVTLESTDHPLALEQRQGIDMKRVLEIAHGLLHEDKRPQ